jgi:hypothetical protein
MAKSVSYLNVAKNIEENLEQESSIKKLEKKGWIVLNKKSISDNLIKLEKKKILEKESKLNNQLKKGWDNYCNESCIRWDKYKDEDIELYGDRSIYYNYKSELDLMIQEEDYIREEIHKISSGYYNENDSDYNSEDENY